LPAKAGDIMTNVYVVIWQGSSRKVRAQILGSARWPKHQCAEPERFVPTDPVPQEVHEISLASNAQRALELNIRN
jgi:hypothetical protein